MERHRIPAGPLVPVDSCKRATEQQEGYKSDATVFDQGFEFDQGIVLVQKPSLLLVRTNRSPCSTGGLVAAVVGW